MDPGSNVERARDGERVAREALFERHVDRLRLYVEFRLGRALARRVEVEDVVQETFLRAWRDLERATLSGDNAFFGWIATIARHVITDVARAARARCPSCDPGLERRDWSRAGERDPVDPGSGPVTRTVRNETGERLRAAFQALSPQHRRVIALRQFEQRSARDAAPQLGCSEMAVHALFRRALDAWARELERADG